MLFALLLGIAFNFLGESENTGPGIKIASRGGLRLGVALLGVQITWQQIGDLGLTVVVLVVGGVLVTLVGGSAIARSLGLSRHYSVISAGAVAICGASAALAVASVLPRNPRSEHDTALAVIGVTTLSTLAMMLYPLLPAMLGLGDQAAGVFIGATIHDVAQVVGAGYTISERAGETATIVKLLRVACIAPAVMAIGLMFRSSEGGAITGTAPLLPAFLVGFVVIVALNSLGAIPGSIQQGLSATSRWLMLSAVAALGMRTSLKKLVAVGFRPLLALIGQTLLLALFVLCVFLLADSF